MYYHVRFSWIKRVIMNKWPNFVKYSQALVLDWRELIQFYYEAYLALTKKKGSSNSHFC